MCAAEVASYEETYGLRYSDHTHPDFDRTLAFARQVSSSDAPSCKTLQALATSIRADRGEAPAGALDIFSGPEDLTARQYLAVAMMVLLMLVTFAAHIWLVVLGFQESVVWGLVVLFAPFGQLIFVIMNWSEAKTPFLLNLGATVGIVFAILMIA